MDSRLMMIEEAEEFSEPPPPLRPRLAPPNALIHALAPQRRAHQAVRPRGGAPRTAHARRTGRAAAAERRRTVREETATVTACALT